MVIAKRARSREQKYERRQGILEAARRLFQTRGFQEINIADIARSAGMAKGTVFLYFKSKEELFLALTYQEFEQMFDALEAGLQATAAERPGRTLDKPRLMGLLQKVLGPREVLMRLIAIQHIILEQNIRYQEARAFKLMLTRRVQSSGAWLDRMISFFRPGQGTKFVMWMYAFVIGFAHVAEPAPVIRKVYAKEPEVMKLKVDFGIEFFAAVTTVWDGWLAASKKTRSRKDAGHAQSTF